MIVLAKNKMRSLLGEKRTKARFKEYFEVLFLHMTKGQ